VILDHVINAKRRAIAKLRGDESIPRKREIVRAAVKAAQSPEGDSAAQTKLAGIIRDSPRAAQHALKMLRHSRDQFDSDRAYRLLEAALSGLPVQPIAPPDRELFAQEESLGRQPMSDAFARLKLVSPGLGELEATVDQEISSLGQSDFTSVRRRLAPLVGPAASDQLDSIARSQIALTIAAQYLAILGGDSRYGTQDTPYFAAPQKLYLRSGTIDRTPPEAPLPVP
jgi:hypothetical protein